MTIRVISISVVAATLLGLSVGCSSDADPKRAPIAKIAHEPMLTAERAKEALLDRMRSGGLSGFDAQQWAKAALQEAEDGWFDFGGTFRVNPSMKKYTMVIEPPPNVRACTFTFEGTFLLQEGRWVAGPTRVVGSALGRGK
jgi:hypothetical protein